MVVGLVGLWCLDTSCGVCLLFDCLLLCYCSFDFGEWVAGMIVVA